MLNAVSGLIKPMAGEIVLEGERIETSSAESIAGKG